MKLDEEILKDYGTVCLKIGKYLLKNDVSGFQEIVESTEMESDIVRDGLTILIQRRIVKFYEVEKNVKYMLDKEILHRRLYFPLYMNFVASNFSESIAKTFKNVMLKGTFKVAQEADSETVENINKLLLESILIEDSVKSRKATKLSSRIFFLNFDTLDVKILQNVIYSMISSKYNIAAAEVYKAIFRADSEFNKSSFSCKLNTDLIIENLKNTKILIDDRGMLINEKQNIREYIRYLINSGVVRIGHSESKEYLLDYSTKNLKIFRVSKLISDKNTKRLFNMIAHNPNIGDGEITINSMIGNNRVKLSLVALQKLGLVSQRCVTPYKQSSRIEHTWSIDWRFLSRNISDILEGEILEKLEEYNKHWDVNYFLDDIDNAEFVWISDILGLCTDHLIFNLF